MYIPLDGVTITGLELPPLFFYFCGLQGCKVVNLSSEQGACWLSYYKKNLGYYLEKNICLDVA
jgi:hypothetical protein